MSPVSRRDFFAQSAALGLALVGRCLLADGGVKPARESSADLIQADTEAAIKRALDYLAARQNDDGSFGGGGSGLNGRNVAVCSLAGLAFMAHGSTPGRGPYGRNVTRVVNYLLKHTRDDGFITVPDVSSHGPMYEHGFATLFLAEVYGMTSDTQVREKLAKAVKLIINTQNSEGGWRYMPQRSDADLSVTICQVMALRAARNAGLHVPNDTIDACTAYVKRCQNPDGGFMYTAQGGESQFPRSAAGIVSLYSAGIYEGEEITKGLDYLYQHLPRAEVFGRDAHFFYGHYYAVQAFWHSGGERWRRWYKSVNQMLLARQKDDGSWFDPICSEYGTAMAVIVLQMPNNYLPIFQN